MPWPNATTTSQVKIRSALRCAACQALTAWGWCKRFLTISGLYLVLGLWASAVAAPGTIDGLIYLRPEITPFAHLMVQPEIVVQGLILGAWVARWMVPRAVTQATNVKLAEV